MLILFTHDSTVPILHQSNQHENKCPARSPHSTHLLELTSEPHWTQRAVTPK